MKAAEKKKSAHDKVEEILSEMKNLQLLKKTEPSWVKKYEANTERSEDDFAAWLQFVYLPNCIQDLQGLHSNIVPQALQYFGNDLKRGRLLQLLIELDAII